MVTLNYCHPDRRTLKIPGKPLVVLIRVNGNWIVAKK